MEQGFNIELEEGNKKKRLLKRLKTAESKNKEELKAINEEVESQSFKGN